MPFRMGPWEIGLIVVIILIIFGVGKLPQVGEAIGKALRAFRKGQSGEAEPDKKDEDKEKPRPKKSAAKKVDKS